VLESLMLVHRSCIARLHVPARASDCQLASPAVLKREALDVVVDVGGE